MSVSFTPWFEHGSGMFRVLSPGPELLKIHCGWVTLPAGRHVALSVEPGVAVLAPGDLRFSWHDSI